MQTKQIIQTSANVIRITNIKSGDVYKIFDKDYSDRVYFGIVRSVHNDGTSTVIEAVEYLKRWSDLEISYKIIHGEKDYVLFPATPDELNQEIEGAKVKIEKEIEEGEKKIEEQKKLLSEIEEIISGELLKNLKQMSYSEISQEQFDEKKKLIEAM